MKMKSIGLFILLSVLPFCCGLTCLEGTEITVAGGQPTGSLQSMTCSDVVPHSCLRIETSSVIFGISTQGKLGICIPTSSCNAQTCDNYQSLIPSSISSSVCTAACCDTDDCVPSVFASQGTGGSGSKICSINCLLCLLTLVISVIFN